MDEPTVFYGTPAQAPVFFGLPEAATLSPIAFEYLNHLIPFEPGPTSDMHRLLNSFAGDGWRVVSSFPVPLPGSQLVGGRPGALALWVLLERAKASSA